MFANSNWLKWLLIGVVIWIVIGAIKWPFWIIFWIAPLLIGPIRWHGEPEKRKAKESDCGNKTPGKSRTDHSEYHRTADGKRLEIIDAPGVSRNFLEYNN